MNFTSQETAARSADHPQTQPVQVVSAAPQATNQQNGAAELNDYEAPTGQRGVPQRNVPFKERVIGVAQKTRGTLLGKPELKEHGEAILEGKTTHEQDRLT